MDKTANFLQAMSSSRGESTADTHAAMPAGPVRRGPTGTSLIGATCQGCGKDIVRGKGAWRHSTWGKS